jgi:hypothetical protein
MGSYETELAGIGSGPFNDGEHVARKCRRAQLALKGEPLTIDVFTADRVNGHEGPAGSKANAVAKLNIWHEENSINRNNPT